MSNRPKIYAHCAAGCKWETVHLADFAEVAAFIKQYRDSNGYYHLEQGKEYKIFCPLDSQKQFRGKIGFVDTDTVTPIDITNDDEYATGYIFRLLGQKHSDSSPVITTVIYEFAGTRYKEEIKRDDSLSLPLMVRVWAEQGAEVEVYMYNSNATATAVLSEEVEQKLKDFEIALASYTDDIDALIGGES